MKKRSVNEIRKISDAEKTMGKESKWRQKLIAILPVRVIGVCYSQKNEFPNGSSGS
jgi:hypothetical protein